MKYYKVEDVISKIVNTPTRVITDDLAALADRQHEIIDMLADLPTIEVSEDCISRAEVLSIISDCQDINDKAKYNTLAEVFNKVLGAPSVVPKPKEGE